MFWKYFIAGYIGYVLGGMTVIEILFRIEIRKLKEENNKWKKKN